MGEKRTRRKEEEYVWFHPKKTKEKEEERVQLKKVLWRYVMRFTQKKKTNGLRLKNKKWKEEIVLKKGQQVCVFSPKTKGQPKWYKRVV
jgi:hypothetical protein